MNSINSTPMSGRAAYGAFASGVAASFAADEPVVVFDHTGAAEALRDCMRRKFAGEPFFVRPVLPREDAARADLIAPSINATYSTNDERRLAFEQAFSGMLQVNGQLLRDIAIYMAPQLRLMQAAVRLADGVAVSSECERRRVADRLGTDSPSQIRAIDDVNVPANDHSSAHTRDAIVVWAAHLSGDAANAFVTALAETRFPILVVSSTPFSNERAQWFPLGRAHEALKRARLILDAHAHGCDAIGRLAAWGVPVVADVESGAQEHYHGVRLFDRARHESIFEAVIAQIGNSAPTPRNGAHASSRLDVSSPDLLADGPRVSVILPTFDRPDMICEALESIARQTYRNVETIVVVDGGPSLEAIQPRFPNVRFIHMAENNGVVSTNTAFAAATGEYIAILNDDDLFFPDHVAALVSALERSGADVAHGDVMTAFLRGERGHWELYGLESNMSRATSSRAFLLSNQIGATSTMFRRTCIEGNEPFDATIPFYRDYELWLRLSLRFDFIHVERVTSCYTIRNQGARQQSVMWRDQTLEAYEAIYARYPLRDRPLLQAQREGMLVAARAGQLDLQAQPAAEIQPVPWPLL